MLSHWSWRGICSTEKAKEGKFCLLFPLFSVVIEKSSSGVRIFYSTTQLFFLVCPWKNSPSGIDDITACCHGIIMSSHTPHSASFQSKTVQLACPSPAARRKRWQGPQSWDIMTKTAAMSMLSYRASLRSAKEGLSVCPQHPGQWHQNRTTK